MHEFLDEVYFRLEPEVTPYKYGSEWLLKHIVSGTILTSPNSAGRLKPDYRTLSEAGVVGGSQWEVIRP